MALSLVAATLKGKLYSCELFIQKLLRSYSFSLKNMLRHKKTISLVSKNKNQDETKSKKKALILFVKKQVKTYEVTVLGID